MGGISNRSNIKLQSWLQFIISVAGIILVAALCSRVRIRLDLTEDKRYTLSAPTKKILDEIRNDIYVQVYLDGDIPVPLKRLKRSVQEMLDEFRVASDRHIDYEFINPSEAKDSREREALYNSLFNKGLNPVNIQARDEEGGKTQKLIFPGMIVNYNEIEIPVNFLKNNPSVSYEHNILNSIEGLEYELVQTIATATSDTIYKIAFIEGHGELQEVEVADITINLARYFTVDRGIIGGKPGSLDSYAAIIIADPEREFSEEDKLIIDQFIMNGGKVLWLAEEVYINSDSLFSGETVGLYNPLNIEDQLFRYGVRINPEIVQDIDCQVIRLSVTTGGEQKQIVPAPWLYYPVLTPNQHHPVSRNLNKVKGEFVNTIDTVGLDTSIRKTVLLTSSAFARTLSPPMLIRLKEAETSPSRRDFTKSHLPVAVLLEGVFPSAFKNRMTTHLISDSNFKIRTGSSPTKMIVIADGDIIRNEVRRTGTSESPFPLGQDKYTGELYGNRDFIVNCLNYLIDDNGLLELRSRELKLRLLDKQRLKDEKFFWQMINIFSPVLLVILSGLVYSFIRRRKYARN